MVILYRAGRGAPWWPDDTELTSVYMLSASMTRVQATAAASMAGLDGAVSSAVIGECGVRQECGERMCIKRGTLPK